MTDTTGTLVDVAQFGWPLFPQGLFRLVAVSAFAIVASVAVAGMIAASFTGNADLKADRHNEVPVILAPTTLALADPFGRLDGSAYSFDWDKVLNRSTPPHDVMADAAPPPPAAATATPAEAAPASPSVATPSSQTPSSPPAAATASPAEAVSPSPSVAAPPAQMPPAPPAAAPPSPPKASSDLARGTPVSPSAPPVFRGRARRWRMRSLARQVTPPNATPGPVAAAPDNRNFFEKLFNVPQQPSGQVLAYAQPEAGSIRTAPTSALPTTDGHTAIYDIAAHTVYLPDGERLEAHSGLGGMLDDPGHVNAKGRGATPPHLYDLTVRRPLFHGVEALRLNPVGSGDMYGRTGLLAHTYMLGPKGDSNGCVSFRDYSKFLQAYLSGQVTRLAVVAHLS